MVTHGHAYRDTCEIARRITERVRTPISVLVAPPALNAERLENLKSIGVDMIGIGLDAVTEELFADIRTDVPAGGLKWDKYWDVLGRRPGGVRALEGQRPHRGRAGRDRRTTCWRCSWRCGTAQVLSYLFCFNPEPGTRMAGHPKPSLRRWRRVQLARHLIGSRRLRPGPVRLRRRRRAGPCPGHSFGPGGTSWPTATAFMTDGCPGGKGEPGCTRPFGSYRPGEPFRDYPFAPEASDLEEIRQSVGAWRSCRVRTGGKELE